MGAESNSEQRRRWFRLYYITHNDQIKPALKDEKIKKDRMEEGAY
jgi:hypothetical protein